MVASGLVLLSLVLSGVVAGVLGALIGIGGGVIIVPTLVLGFGMDIKIAIACSLVAVVASSTAAGSVYVGKGLTNMRLGMLLEVATTLGGLGGGFVALYASSSLISGLFSILLFIVCFLVLRSTDSEKKDMSGRGDSQEAGVNAIEQVGFLAGTYYDPFLKSTVNYHVRNVLFGSVISFMAGILSGMLGVGGGFIKVPAMTLGMKVPMKVATATSNFMIGVTAIASLFVYFNHGFVQPMVAAPIAIGVVGGAFYGTVLAQKISSTTLKRVFSTVLILVALQMLLKSLGVAY
ncbi:MAG: sulfite exporter TauE/SafE family protein [Bdellovibrionaceae bacterium]|nr:sulfite exporter TauE/SafE family protein [Pseudobdellovibrionaceae bacterium]